MKYSGMCIGLLTSAQTTPAVNLKHYGLTLMVKNLTRSTLAILKKTTVL